MKTSELTDAALDWAVTKAAGYLRKQGDHWMVKLPYVRARMNFVPGPRCCFSPSTRWAQGGPIIEGEGLRLHRSHTGEWWAGTEADPHRPASGSSPLIAAMRCYVASRLGDEVDVPDELLHRDGRAALETFNALFNR